MDLEEKYKEETGFNVGKIHDIGTTYYSNDYVEWLEKQLNMHFVSNSEAKCCEPAPKFALGTICPICNRPCRIVNLT